MPQHTFILFVARSDHDVPPNPPLKDPPLIVDSSPFRPLQQTPPLQSSFPASLPPSCPPPSQLHFSNSKLDCDSFASQYFRAIRFLPCCAPPPSFFSFRQYISPISCSCFLIDVRVLIFRFRTPGFLNQPSLCEPSSNPFCLLH